MFVRANDFYFRLVIAVVVLAILRQIISHVGTGIYSVFEMRYAAVRRARLRIEVSRIKRERYAVVVIPSYVQRIPRHRLAFSVGHDAQPRRRVHVSFL